MSAEPGHVKKPKMSLQEKLHSIVAGTFVFAALFAMSVACAAWPGAGALAFYPKSV
jgi:hypothetical protein